ncbi:carboxylesterase family protein [Streptosporangium sp. NPDC051023]|uniref:carboxylesterase/lipase family protein n=1 Tax=Streptosporangium sp. NPDC051023 TaxID=3155410 RepID=UPI00344B31E8
MHVLRTVLAAATLVLVAGSGAVRPAFAATAPSLSPSSMSLSPSLSPSLSMADRTLVTVSDGPLKGVASGDVRVFRNVPYAAPPTGALRFASPRPPAKWTEPRDASHPGNRCPQAAAMGSGGSLDEDCLTLEVTAPAKGGKRPVIVWLHGGVGLSGSGIDYDARRLASQGGVVVVAPNFRIGVLAALQHPALDASSATGSSGSWGVEDQLAALRWVRKNVAAFGGDPGNVTIAGQSAGSTAVCGLLLTPLAKGLFDRAVMQSGPCDLRWAKNALFEGTPPSDGRPMSQKEKLPGNLRTAASLGCPDEKEAAACLRALPVQKFMDAQATGAEVGGGWGTAIQPVRDPLGKGAYNRVPVMIGATSHESRLFLSLRFDLQGKPLTAAQYPEKVRESFGKDAGRVLRHYPLKKGARPAETLAAVYTDHGWFCPTLTTAKKLTRRTPVHIYEFAETPVSSVPGLSFNPGAAHGTDVSYLFDYQGKNVLKTKAQRAFAKTVIKMWARFAATGDPNGPGLPSWPRAPRVLALDSDGAGIRPVDAARAHQCGFWK